LQKIKRHVEQQFTSAFNFHGIILILFFS
jgi:hypothetical protein